MDEIGHAVGYKVNVDKRRIVCDTAVGAEYQLVVGMDVVVNFDVGGVPYVVAVRKLTADVFQ